MASKARVAATNYMIVRRAIAADVPAVVALLADDLLGQQREHVGDSLDADYVAAFAMIAADPNQYLAVCVIESVIIGCVQISFIPGLTRRGALRGQIEGVRIPTGGAAVAMAGSCCYGRLTPAATAGAAWCN